MLRVSIILPTYNGSKFISRAILGVVNQSFTDWELLVIDDGSTDNTAEIVSKLSSANKQIQLIINPVNLGIQKTLNRGLQRSRGELVARIDDDDEWIDKDKLKKQVEFLDQHPEYVLIGCGTVMVNEAGQELVRYLLPEHDSMIRDRILGKNCFTHSSVLFRLGVAQKLGGYSEDEKVKHIEDYDLWLKLGTLGKFANLPFYGVRFMVRPEAISESNKINQFKKNLVLTRRFRNKYPHYLGALFRGYTRLWLYGWFKLIPLAVIKNRLLKIYKES